MGIGCAEGHGEAGKHEADRKSLLRAMGLTALVMVVEIAGGIYSGSLALLSDAGHMFTDVLALGLALFAVTMARRPAPARATFGWYRVEILSALANGVLLVLVALGILIEAYRRVAEPPAVHGPALLAVALLGLAANAASYFLLRGASREGINVRGAAMHVLGDALSSGAVVVSALVILTTGWTRIDPILAGGIGLVIVGGAVRLLKEAVDILLEASPVGIDLGCLCDDIRAVEGVREVHDLHIWSITSGMTALSGHVVVDGRATGRSDDVLNRIKSLLSDRYRITHTTIQIESEAYQEIGEVH